MNYSELAKTINDAFSRSTWYWHSVEENIEFMGQLESVSGDYKAFTLNPKNCFVRSENGWEKCDPSGYSFAENFGSVHKVSNGEYQMYVSLVSSDIYFYDEETFCIKHSKEYEFLNSMLV